ncbi:RidA family protein [Plantactinospora sp. KLBMP9567]|uniref:RidA family protein n=1 Tax=Plantactinospora sp. KLBMP9567 TaxID=3085900 RepID=UPI002981114E|nr:RidA family protein [Plantactinospora sp. KLBMP9567]MDW5326432.1 RidA family protein [Plantactinospora sp. KLBMP9567]
MFNVTPPGEEPVDRRPWSRRLWRSVTFRNPSPRRVHPPIAGFHHQAEVHGGRWLALSGQFGIRPDGYAPDGQIEQLGVALENVRQNLITADLLVYDVVKLTIYLVGDADMDPLRAELAKWLDGHAPTLSILFVAGLVGPSFRVQVDALAAAPFR